MLQQYMPADAVPQQYPPKCITCSRQFAMSTADALAEIGITAMEEGGDEVVTPEEPFAWTPKGTSEPIPLQSAH